MKKKSDQRPPVAIGHVRLPVNDVKIANDYFELLGLRPIFVGDGFSVMELRGGTHVILAKSDEKIQTGAMATFDLMVDDIDGAKDDYVGKGFAASDISRGSIHDSFVLTAPDGYAIKINSSHTGKRAV